MAKHYLIGIGGTGARVVEAVLHCCAAGFAPEGLTDLTVFLVDPDEGNGNLSRTKTLVAQYQRARDALAERDRLALLMREEGLDYGEIAEALGLSVGSVGTTLARARRRLVEHYEALARAGRAGGAHAS